MTKNGQIIPYGDFLTEIPSAFHIAVDANAVEDEGSRVRGIGRYMFNQFKELIRLKPEWRFTLYGIYPQPAHSEISELASFGNCEYHNWQDFPLLRPDLLYVTHPMGPIAQDVLKLGAATGTPIATTFHDLIPLIFPEMYLNPFPHLKQKYYEQLALLREHCGLFLCNSQCTAHDLAEKAKIPPEHLRVIHAGVTENFSQPPEDDFVSPALSHWDLVREKYFLFTGVPDQRKNAYGMFSAFNYALKALKEDLKLVIVGDIPGFLMDILKNMQIRSGLPEKSVIYTGFISDEELNALYHNGLALLFPSLYEGFGFPIVEAQSAGLPVIVGRNSSMPEITGEGGILVDAQNTNEIADAIIDIFFNKILRQKLREKGLRNSRKFNWQSTAQKTAEYIEEKFVHKYNINLGANL
jgi:glycosyltransferase involved in cell wall biosynthesis